MGMNLDAVIYLQRQGFLDASKNRILDIGPQTVYFAKAEQIAEIVRGQGREAADPVEVERIVHFSTPRPGERTTMLSEITDLTNIDYVSIDVCPGLKNTRILDLNLDSLPNDLHGRFDVVFNFGTTEHIINQWNCFEVIHDALKVGGVAFHQLPASGYLDHGYFCYTPLFFRELAAANGYTIERMALSPAGDNKIDAMSIDVLHGDTILKPLGHLKENNRVPAFNIHVVMRKTRDRALMPTLEVATAHSGVDSGILMRHKRMQARRRWSWFGLVR